MPNIENDSPRLTELQRYTYGDKLTMIIEGSNPDTGQDNIFGTIDKGIDTTNGEITQVQTQLTAIQGKQDTAFARAGAIAHDTSSIVSAIGQTNGILDTISENLMIKAGQGITVSADRTISIDNTDYGIIQSMPAIEFGVSNSLTVSANSNITGDIDFQAGKTEAPLVFCQIQATTELHCIITQVTNAQFSFTLYNGTNTDAENVTVNWFAVSGR